MTAAISPRVESHKTGKALTVALWIVQVLLAGMFFLAGGHKVAGDPQMVGLFDAIGIGQWFRYVTGILEIGGGILLLVPRVQAVGAALLSAVMLGARSSSSSGSPSSSSAAASRSRPCARSSPEVGGAREAHEKRGWLSICHGPFDVWVRPPEGWLHLDVQNPERRFDPWNPE
jgi:uncharacterized membrane protein YphA (DoxX/SURF4 family)